MVMQMRVSKDDPRWYDPNRDLAHCFPNMAQEAAERIDNPKWPAMQQYMEDNNVTVDQLMDTFTAISKFVMSASENPEETLEGCLIRSGYMKLPQAATFTYMAVLGGIVLGSFFSGRRNAYLGPDTVTVPYTMLSSGRRIRLLLSISPWRRKVYLCFRAIKQTYRNLKLSLRGS